MCKLRQNYFCRQARQRPHPVLIIEWDWGDGTSTEHIYYNNGMSPDPYPSPDVNPITIADRVMHSYALSGTYTVTLTVTDDDGGQVTILIVLSI